MGDHALDVLVPYREERAYDLTLTQDRTDTPNCNGPSFSNLSLPSATWTYAPVQHTYYDGPVAWTRNHTATFTLHSRRQSYGGLWRFYSTPKDVIVVSDS